MKTWLSNAEHTSTCLCKPAPSFCIRPWILDSNSLASLASAPPSSQASVSLIFILSTTEFLPWDLIRKLSSSLFPYHLYPLKFFQVLPHTAFFRLQFYNFFISNNCFWRTFILFFPIAHDGSNVLLMTLYASSSAFFTTQPARGVCGFPLMTPPTRGFRGVLLMTQR